LLITRIDDGFVTCFTHRDPLVYYQNSPRYRNKPPGQSMNRRSTNNLSETPGAPEVPTAPDPTPTPGYVSIEIFLSFSMTAAIISEQEVILDLQICSII
jgi:hypothetical protein